MVDSVELTERASDKGRARVLFFSSTVLSMLSARSHMLCQMTQSLTVHRQNVHKVSTPSLGYRRVYRMRSCIARNNKKSEEQQLEPQRAIDTEDEEDVLVIEQQMMKNKKKNKKKPGDSKPYTVVSATRDSVYGDGPQSALQQFETNVIGVLGLLFGVILLEGIFLGASGFLSEEADQFAQDVVYPLFSPTLGLFLAGSTAYGLWKTREDESSSNKNE